MRKITARHRRTICKVVESNLIGSSPETVRKELAAAGKRPTIRFWLF